MSSLLTRNITPSAFTRPANAKDAKQVQRLYAQAPSYTANVTMKVPSVAEVYQDLYTAQQDSLRHTELVLCPTAEHWRIPSHVAAESHDPESQRLIIGYLDYKVDYPQEQEVMINLLLIPEPLQGQGWGTRIMQELELRLANQYRHILASVYGRNPATTRFWQRLGYHHALDAQPIMDWYGKDIAKEQLFNVY